MGEVKGGRLDGCGWTISLFSRQAVNGQDVSIRLCHDVHGGSRLSSAFLDLEATRAISFRNSTVPFDANVCRAADSRNQEMA